MPNKIIVFTIKEHSLWKELWGKLKTIHSGGWNIGGLFINMHTGIVTEEIPLDKFGENFFTDNRSYSFKAIRFLKDDVNVFLVMQTGTSPNTGREENTKLVSIILNKHAIGKDDVFIAHHSSGGQINCEDTLFNKIMSEKTIKLHPKEFVHNDNFVFKRVQEWINNNMKDGLDKLLDEIRGNINPQANIEILKHHLEDIKGTIAPNLNGLINAKEANDIAEELSIMKEALKIAEKCRIEYEITLFNDVRNALKIKKCILSDLSKNLLKIDKLYKQIYELVYNSTQFVEKKENIIKCGDELIELLDETINIFEGNNNE